MYCPWHGYHNVAKLIGTTFFGRDANVLHVVHKNGDPSDNRLANLQLVKNAGEMANKKGNRRLNLYELREVHRRLNDGMAQTRIAVEVGVSTRCVRYHHRECQCDHGIR